MYRVRYRIFARLADGTCSPVIDYVDVEASDEHEAETVARLHAFEKYNHLETPMKDKGDEYFEVSKA